MAKEKAAAKDKATAGKDKAAVGKEKAAAAKSKLTKSAFFQQLADATEMKKTEVQAVYEAMLVIVQKQLGPKGPGELTLPNLVKLAAVHTKADKGGKKAKNPFTGEEYTTKPRPAKTKLKARGLKNFLESITKK